MYKEQKEWFEKLVKDREDSAKTLEKPSMRGVKNSVVEKYSDQAHFIYELLQNANDAQATKSSFRLTSDGLYFKHNGSIGFTVSNPHNEDEDKISNSLGHINSITSIANSNKTDSSIGKFGVGFKAVFQYTETPHIYDPNFQFKIERFIVPQKLENDLSERNTDETIFYFPFDKKEMPEEQAYSDILGKLKRLIYPTLFLFNLQEVSWETDTESGEYSKKSKSKPSRHNIACEKLELYQQVGLEQTKEKLWLFTRFIEKGQVHSYSVGFFLGANGKLKTKNIDAFCFFPTKENTGLNFIIHAPFLLTDSREGIKKGQTNNWNENLIEKLAQLSADSLLILKDLKLIDDEIIRIIPYNQLAPFFAPFYNAIKEIFQKEELLPSLNGEFANKQNAYWAVEPESTKLFSNVQLAQLIKNLNAKWVFPSISRTESTELRDYIDGGDERSWVYREPNLIKSNLDFENKITNLIDADFIQNQSFEWLYKFYAHFDGRSSYLKKYKTKSIFLDKNKIAVSAFEQREQAFYPILFLPSSYTDSPYKHIHPELLKNEKSKEFIENFGIKKPSLKDEIYNGILPLYDNEGDIDTKTHFKKFFKFWKEEGRPEDFINLIKDKEFISYKTKEDDTTYRGPASEIYYPTIDLQNYFDSKPDTKFVDLDDYYGFITDDKDKIHLKDFILKLGVSELPRILDSEIIDLNEKNSIKSKLGESLKYGSSGYSGQGTFDKIIDGCKEIIKNIDIDKSLQLWVILGKLRILKLEGDHKYFYYSQQYQYFESSTLKLLKSSKWLLSINNELVAPTEISLVELADSYEINTDLEHLLGFIPSVALSVAERIAQKFDNEEEAELAKRLLEEHKLKQNNKATSNNFDNESEVEDDKTSKVSRIERTIKDLDDLQNQFAQKPEKINAEKVENESKPEIDFDEDEEFAQGIDDLKKQLEIKKSRVELVENINNSTKYSYDWFKAYLKLLTTYNEKQDSIVQKSLSFQEIKPYKADNKYFLLCGGSNYVSAEIENSNDFRVSLVFGSGKKENIKVEGVSKKGQDLLVYCPESLPSNTLSRLSTVFKVELNFTPVIDLLDRLQKAFTNSSFIDEWEEIQEAMPALNYIYGPPGTGKTTTICNNINDIINNNPNAKFLVLTPTNKAADVVCKKLQEINLNINAIRLSRPTDPEVSEYTYRETLAVDDMYSVNVVASTIHRLPYFDIQNVGLLFQYDWDYVIFDESSMTGLHYITFALMALYKFNPDIHCIIAGDPKQIPPIIEIDDKDLENFNFQDENIYKMMGLESFKKENQKIREIDTIQNLDLQYRAVPQIGQLFSELSYASLLKHDRTTNRKEVKPLPEEFKKIISSNVTFIDIPLDKNNSIYKINKLIYSSYHTYCSILVSEIIKYFDSTNNNEQWTIGLISPYKAQATLLNKLISSYGISENIKVYSDTVHGFQGDECDIVFFVCNPNNYYYSGHEKSLLSKEYIYNVAISRAKDYLVVLHPYSINNPYISNIGISYKNNFGNAKILRSIDIEEILFNEKNYIENNSYVSGHDVVNVFGLSEMKYFIKANDTAIDIQLRDIKNYETNGLSVETNFRQTELANQNGGLKIVGQIDLSKFEKYKKKRDEFKLK